ncbi:unnamed protein product [Urochloa humidicola]
MRDFYPGPTPVKYTDPAQVFDPPVHRRGSHPGDRRDGATAAQVWWGRCHRRDSETMATKGSFRRWLSSSSATFNFLR